MNVIGHLGGQHVARVSVGGQRFSNLCAANVDGRRLDDVPPQFFDSVGSPEREVLIERRRFVSPAHHYGQVTGIDELVNSMPVDQIIHTVGSE